MGFMVIRVIIVTFLFLLYLFLHFFRAELDEHREIISQLEADRHSLTRKVETMEKEMKKKKTELNEWKMKANEFQSKLSKVCKYKPK